MGGGARTQPLRAPSRCAAAVHRMCAQGGIPRASPRTSPTSSPPPPRQRAEDGYEPSQEPGQGGGRKQGCAACARAAALLPLQRARAQPHARRALLRALVHARGAPVCARVRPAHRLVPRCSHLHTAANVAHPAGSQLKQNEASLTLKVRGRRLRGAHPASHHAAHCSAALRCHAVQALRRPRPPRSARSACSPSSAPPRRRS